MKLKNPPHSIPSEQAVIGSILIDSSIVSVVKGVVSPQDFYRQEHTEIMKAAYSLSENEQPTDIVSVGSLLKEKGKLDFIGGMTYLIRLADSVPNSANAEVYAKKVKELSIRRNVIRAGGRISEMGFDMTEDVETLLLKAQESLTKVELIEKLESVGDKFQQIINEYRKEPPQISTGYTELDSYCRFSRGDLILLEGDTKNGKTTFAMNLLLRALRKKYTALYLTYEIPVVRFIPLLARIWNGEIPRDRQEGEEHIAKFMAEFGENLFVLPDEKTILGLEEFMAKTIALSAKRKIDFIFIDYDQMVGTKTFLDNEERRLSYIAKKSKELAMATDSVVILLSQVNAEGKARWSREKEYFASVVIRLKKDEVLNDLNVWVPYNRYGRALNEDNALTFEVDWARRQIGKYNRKETK